MLEKWRRTLGQFAFQKLVLPPILDSKRVTRYCGDYGHAYRYEDLFCRDRSDIDAIAGLIDKAKGPVLDFAGGAGRLSHHLVSLGHEVTLVDSSNEMLARAEQAKLSLSPENRARWRLEKSDLRDFRTSRHFSAVIALNNGLEHTGGREGAATALRRLRDSLEEGGEAFIDVHYQPYWRDWPWWKTGEWRYVGDAPLDSRKHRLWERTLPGTTFEEVIWEHAVSRDCVRFVSMRTSIWVLHPLDWESLLAGAGLRVIDRWGDWRRAPVTPSSPKIIFRAVAESKRSNLIRPN